MAWLVLWMLGCGGMPPEEAARLGALEARVAELEQQLAEARNEAQLEANAEAEERAKRREEIRERLRRLRAEREGAAAPETLREAIANLEGLSSEGRLLLHRGPDGAYDGYRLSAIRRGSIAERLGFRNDDVVTRVNDLPLTSMQEAMEAYNAVQNADDIEVVLTREGEQVVLTFSMDAPLPDGEALDEDVVEERTVRELLDDPDRLDKLGRALLHRDPLTQVVDGYRLSAIRHNSAPDLLGINNGDIVHRVGGIEILSDGDVAKAWEAAKQADTIDLEITRRGERITLSIDTSTVVPLD